MKRKSIFVCFIVLFLTIGYAAVSNNLNVSGVVNVNMQDDFDIIFSNAKLNGTEKKEFIVSDKKTINFQISNLKTLNSQATLGYTVANKSRNYDALVTIECKEIGTSYLNFDETFNVVVRSGFYASGNTIASITKANPNGNNINVTCTLNSEPIGRDALGYEYIEPTSTSGILRKVNSTVVKNDSDDLWGYAKDITKIIFEDSFNYHDTSDDMIFDISANRDRSVMGYVVPNETDSTTYTAYIQGDMGVKANSNSSYLFKGFSKLTSIEGLEYFDTSQVEYMTCMFYSCSSIETLDLSFFNIKNVVSMTFMFGFCKELVSLKMPSVPALLPISIDSMFRDCYSLVDLDFGDFDKNNFREMDNLFKNCYDLKILNLSNFNTESITDMSSMFEGCHSLESLNIENFVVDKVEQMQRMFYECYKLTDLKFSNLTMFAATDASEMFYNCSKLTTTITIKPNFNGCNYNAMFSGAATDANALITIKYYRGSNSLIESMLDTKSTNSNIVASIILPAQPELS